MTTKRGVGLAGQVLGLADDPALAGPACEGGVRNSENRRAGRPRRSASAWASASSQPIFSTSREFLARPMT